MPQRVCLQYNVRDALDLAGTATATTKWVPCKGAVMVVFQWLATNGNNLASQSCECSNLIPLVTGGVGYSPNNAQVASSTNSSTVNAAGGLRQVVVPLNPTNGVNEFIIVEGIRGTAVAGASIVTGLACTAFVYYDDDAFIPQAMTGQITGAV